LVPCLRGLCALYEIMAWFDLTREQIIAVIAFAAQSLQAPPAPLANRIDAHISRPCDHR
jgi:hypothetical protein